MDLSDITVEVRDETYARVGVIPHPYLNLKLSVLHNNVGTWNLTMPSEHPLTEALRTPGSGLIVTGPGGVELMSGPVVKSTYQATLDNPNGILAFDGVTDDIFLADRLAYPNPSNPLPDNTVEADERTGIAETLMYGYVSDNIGPTAPVERRIPGLLMNSNLGRGRTITKKPRFQVLGELLSEIALPEDLGFRIIQRGTDLVFDTFAIRDRTDVVRLDVRNGTLSGVKLVVAAPEITNAIIAGAYTTEPKTEKDRLYMDYWTTISEAAAQVWGRRIERYLSNESAETTDEMDQAGREAFVGKQDTKIAVQVVPLEGETMRFGYDWYLGDRIVVVVDNEEMVSVVTGWQMRADRDGFAVSATLGDPTEFDPSIALRRRMQQTESRLSAIERNG